MHGHHWLGALLVAAALCGLAPQAIAHRTRAAVATPTIAHIPDRGVLPPDSGRATDSTRIVGAPTASFRMPPLGQALAEHLHNKLVHVPIGLAVASVILLLLARRRPVLAQAAYALIWFAALSGVATYVAGRLQEEDFVGEPKQWLMELHRIWGTASAAALVVWAGLTISPRTRRWVPVWAVIVVLLVLVTGFYGGVLSHGE